MVDHDGPISILRQRFVHNLPGSSSWHAEPSQIIVTSGSVKSYIPMKGCV